MGSGEKVETETIETKTPTKILKTYMKIHLTFELKLII